MIRDFCFNYPEQLLLNIFLHKYCLHYILFSIEHLVTKDIKEIISLFLAGLANDGGSLHDILQAFMGIIAKFSIGREYIVQYLKIQKGNIPITCFDQN